MIDSEPPEGVLAAVYDAGADVYDQYWAPFLYPHARALLACLPARQDRTILDVGAGTGTLAPTLRAAAGPDGRVILLDRSQGMLCHAPANLPRAVADAARLPIANAAVDVVVFSFVLFLLPDAHAAIAEAARVLRPRRWLLTATWGSQHPTGADDVIRDELDRAGAPAFPTPPRSDQLTDSPARISALLEAAGFTQVRTEQRPLEAQFDPDAALALRTRAGALGWSYAHLDQHTRHAVRRRIATRLAALPPRAFLDRSQVLLTSARSP